ncbi:MAG: nitroreductase [Hyphomicrobiales bacterium]|nr:nitroreductase [Hyphomicrobiales bacterium]
MEAIQNLIERTSSSHLSMPIPSREELNTIYKAALRAPDHKDLKPSRYIEVSGNGLDRLSEVFINFAKDSDPNIDQSRIERYKKMPYRAPLIMVLISSIKENQGVPKIEQMMSTACSAQCILLALNALNYSGIWRTGEVSFNTSISKLLGLEDNEFVIGYLYIGTDAGPKKNIQAIEYDDFVSIWD